MCSIFYNVIEMSSKNCSILNMIRFSEIQILGKKMKPIRSPIAKVYRKRRKGSSGNLRQGEVKSVGKESKRLTHMEAMTYKRREEREMQTLGN